MASIVRISSESDESILAMISSTRDLSYPIWTSDETRVISDVFLCFAHGEDECLEKSIDPFRSTMIFWAVFFPIPGTEERSLSSSSCIALRRFSPPSPRRLRAVFPHTPLTLRSSRKSFFSSWSVKPKSVSPASLILWWSQISDFSHMRIFARSNGEANISSPSHVPSTRVVIWMPSMERIFPEINENIASK